MSKKEQLNKKWVSIGIFICCLLVLSLVFYFVGYNISSTELDNKKVRHDELVEKIKGHEDLLKEKENLVSDKEKELEGLNSEIATINEKFEEIEYEFKKAEELVGKISELETDIKEMDSEISSKEEKIEGLDNEIKGREDTLVTLSGQIKEAEGKPITLSAGFFTVGKDLPEGRYKVTPNGNGNFFVNGGASVNIMLGRGEYYESEYVFYAYEGDEIELTLSATFTPVE